MIDRDKWITTMELREYFPKGREREVAIEHNVRCRKNVFNYPNTIFWNKEDVLKVLAEWEERAKITPPDWLQNGRRRVDAKKPTT